MMDAQQQGVGGDNHGAGAAFSTIARFTAFGLLLYVALYAASEALVLKYGNRNRFFAIAAAPPSHYKYIVLGASHAGVLDYRDMNLRLEQAVGGPVLNLSNVGAGPVVNRLLLVYSASRHIADAVLYIVDSFAFYKPEWNEERLGDSRLFVRAPFDPTLARLLFASPAPWMTTLQYVTGFAKINNHDRFEPDVREEEGSRFDRRYRPVAQIDRQRLEYLYPAQIDAAARQQRDRYLAELRSTIEEVQQRGGQFIAVRPPIPDRVRKTLPSEDDFEVALAAVLTPLHVDLLDFSRVDNKDEYFYDTDHLNQTGTLRWIEHLGETLQHRSNDERE